MQSIVHNNHTSWWIYTLEEQWLIDWDKVLHPTRHKIDHFEGSQQANLLSWYGKTKPNTTKAHTDQSKEMYYNKNKQKN